MRIREQRGAALIVSLLMLLVLTILASSAIRNSNVNLRIVGNQDRADEAESLTNRAIETVLSDIDNFENPSQQTIKVDGEAVSVPAPECIDKRPASGYSARWDLAPRDTTWEVNAQYTASTGGAAADLTHGVNIRMTQGSCS